MRVTILGKRWNLQFVPRRKGRGWLGLCTSPEQPDRTIKIASGHSPIVELDVTIHECLHATCFPLDEDYVTAAATDIARILWRLGWRKQEQK